MSRLYQDHQHKIILAETPQKIQDAQEALDFAFSLAIEYDTNDIVVSKEAFSESFFDLRSKLAGEILQKFVQYQIRLAIVGDFSQYQSNALKDFIYECNQGSHFFFVSTEEEGITRLKNQ